MMKNTEKTMEKIVALCKGRGFVYPGQCKAGLVEKICAGKSL